jgi:hypothetical protein
MKRYLHVTGEGATPNSNRIPDGTPIDYHAKSPRRGAHAKQYSNTTIREQVIELIDAPTVDFRPDTAKPTRGATDRAEAEVKKATGRLIKP